uniref:Uncharacterized protein n=1 Tax=Alexandrium monilatum TaxID=311494 RepID=A0A6T1HAH4_9DINO|mmetsp:Transcript_58776/g.184503  ORF Transcript_58776/g.184503 Transcript_58776/m.184503 type:complete len:198 (+) Transcript_58776:514-1107(+)
MLPEALSGSELARFARCVRDLRVDNLGAAGVRALLARLGIGDVPAAFVARALRGCPLLAPPAPSALGPLPCRVFCYAEYRVEAVGELLTGSLTRENGLRKDGGLPRPRWLRAVPLPIGAFVDRELCAEFQLLEAACEVLARGGRGGAPLTGASGSLQLVVNGTSCLSCVCAMRQFQILWPGMRLSVGMTCRGGAAGL